MDSLVHVVAPICCDYFFRVCVCVFECGISWALRRLHAVNAKLVPQFQAFNLIIQNINFRVKSLFVSIDSNSIFQTEKKLTAIHFEKIYWCWFQLISVVSFWSAFLTFDFPSFSNPVFCWKTNFFPPYPTQNTPNSIIFLIL